MAGALFASIRPDDVTVNASPDASGVLALGRVNVSVTTSPDTETLVAPVTVEVLTVSVKLKSLDAAFAADIALSYVSVTVTVPVVVDVGAVKPLTVVTEAAAVAPQVTDDVALEAGPTLLYWSTPSTSNL